MLIDEVLEDGWTWWRIADRTWRNPLDPAWARHRGGRWNPSESFPVLYLNEDKVTARLNLRAFIARWPYEPEDLRDDTGPVLVGATLPRKQRVADLHTPEGLRAAKLPRAYPLDGRGRPVSRARCRAIGVRAREQGVRGVRCRSSQSPDGAGRELAWFPATVRSRARRVATLAFSAWYWG